MCHCILNQIWSSVHQGTVEASVCIMGDALHPPTWFSARHLNICQKTLKETSILLSYVGARGVAYYLPSGENGPSSAPFYPQKIGNDIPRNRCILFKECNQVSIFSYAYSNSNNYIFCLSF